jgi:hypothetical protein
MVLHAELPGLADEGDIFAGAVGLDVTEEGFKTLVNRWLGLALLGGRLRIGRKLRRFPLCGWGRARNILRYGLPDTRHASL